METLKMIAWTPGALGMLFFMGLVDEEESLARKMIFAPVALLLAPFAAANILHVLVEEKTK